MTKIYEIVEKVARSSPIKPWKVGLRNNTENRARKRENPLISQGISVGLDFRYPNMELGAENEPPAKSAVMKSISNLLFLHLLNRAMFYLLKPAWIP